MDSKRAARRRFLLGGTGLLGLAVGARPAHGQELLGRSTNPDALAHELWVANY